MNYFETFENLRNTLEKAKIKKAEGHLAIQVCISDPEASGVFYIEDFGDRVFAEPYDYYDNDAEIIGSASSLKSLFEGKVEFQKALENGDITANGNIEALAGFFGRITKAPVKKAAKKTATKTTAKKATKKKTEVGKVTEDTKKNDTKKKETETIKDVVEKEVKPKK